MLYVTIMPYGGSSLWLMDSEKISKSGKASRIWLRAITGLPAKANQLLVNEWCLKSIIIEKQRPSQNTQLLILILSYSSLLKINLELEITLIIDPSISKINQVLKQAQMAGRGDAHVLMLNSHTGDMPTHLMNITIQVLVTYMYHFQYHCHVTAQEAGRSGSDWCH